LRAITAEFAVTLGCASLLVALPAEAQNWRVTPAIDARETFTTNANLAPSDQAKSSFVTVLTPSVTVIGRGPRVELSGTAAVQALVYTGDAADNVIYPQLNLLGRVEAVERFFFVEAAAYVTQTYLSPFGPQPAGNIGETSNRYTAAGFRISPYIQGVLPGGISYLLRNDNIWSNLGNTPNSATGLVGAYVNSWVGRIDSPIRTFGWSADLYTTYTKFTDESALTTKVARAYLHYQPDPQLRLSAIGGYEENDYFVTQSSNVIYGAGAEWRPTERTIARGRWEERFFGSSYLAAINHRNPSWAFDINASRDITTYPQQLLAAPAGGNIAALVDAAFVTRIPDPVQRAVAVQDFLRQNGLPATLQRPLNFYTQQVILYNQQSATATWLGVRNTLAFTVYNRKSEVISGGTGVVLPPPFGAVNNNTQTGGAVTFSHRLTSLTSLNASATYFQTVALSPFTAKSETTYFLAAAVARIGPQTDGYTGLTYSIFNSNVGASDYNVFTAFVGLNHRF
jgi:uncharacterized protein (PEP-CTERM system associated)